MKIVMYGTKNCKSCDILFSNLKETILKLEDKVNVELIKNESIIDMANKSIEEIPALEIDGKIISKGYVYSVHDLLEIITNYNNEIDISKYDNTFICDEKGCRLNDK